MMRDRGGHDTQVLAELTDTGASLGVGVAFDAGNGSWLTTGDQAQEYL